jgi:hypothetical protein
VIITVHIRVEYGCLYTYCSVLELREIKSTIYSGKLIMVSYGLIGINSSEHGKLHLNYE